MTGVAKLTANHGKRDDAIKATEDRLKSRLLIEDRYVIPVWQRRYSWDKEQWTILWEDLEDLADSEDPRPHFFGSLILSETHDPNAHVGDPADVVVIDGQQRLTTAFILIAALRDALAGSASTIKFDSWLFRRDAEPRSAYRLIPQEGDREAFFQVMDGRELVPAVKFDSESSEGIAGDDAELSADQLEEAEDPFHILIRDVVVTDRISKAYKFFLERIGERLARGEGVEPIVAALARLDVVVISLNEDDSWQKIFETVNALGVDLADADLVRNYMFMRIHGADAQRQVFEQYWRPMEERLPKHLTDYLLSYLVMNGISAGVRNKGIYRGYRYQLSLPHETSDAVTVALRQLDAGSEVFQRLLSSDARDCWAADTESRLEFFAQWGSSPMHPLLLLLLVKLRGERLNQALWMLQSFLVRRFIAGTPPNDLRSRFTNITVKLSSLSTGELLPELLQSLSTDTARWATDDQLRKALVTEPVYTPPRTGWVFLTLKILAVDFEVSEKGFAGDVYQGRKAGMYQVEHVMPRNPDNWRGDLSLWGERDPTLYHAEHVDLLPNLTITKFNPDVADNRFEEKRDYFLNENIAMTRHIGDCEVWGRTQLSDRATQLLDAIQSRLPGPQSSWLDK